MDVLRRLSEGSLSTFYVKRDPTIKLVNKDGKVNLSPIVYAFPNEEWEEDIAETEDD